MAKIEYGLSDGDVVWGFPNGEGGSYQFKDPLGRVADAPSAMLVERMGYDAKNRSFQTSKWKSYKANEVNVYRTEEEATREAKRFAYRVWLADLTAAERRSSNALQQAKADIEEHTLLLDKYAKLRGRVAVDFGASGY